MTDDEKRKQKAMLLLECNEAEQDLQHLEYKALELGKMLESIGKWTSGIVGAMHDSGPSGPNYNYWEMEIDGRKYDHKDDAIKTAINHDALVSLMQELRDARIKFQNLCRQKHNLGLI